MWADLARHFRLEPDRVALTGYSMGGYGTYKLGMQWPDLFGAAFTTVGPPAASGFLDTGLDLSTDSITEEERERTLAWYREHHDHGDRDHGGPR